MLLAYLPLDRRHALAAGVPLPSRANGAVLFADLAGFTPLTAALVHALGPQRGAEELTAVLDRVYDTLIEAVDQFGGSVVVFGGDALTAWFEGDTGERAIACALAMQSAMPTAARRLAPQCSLGPPLNGATRPIAIGMTARRSPATLAVSW